jgi:signal transduction histidine kinase
MFKLKVNIISLLTFLILFFLLVFYVTTLVNRVTISDEVQGENGVFDFSKTNFDVHKLNGLNGKAAFYWNKLLEPGQIDQQQPDGLIQIPGIWNGYSVKGEAIGGFGYATYRFKILLPDNDLYALKIKEFENAYKIWINGQLMTETGIVGASKATMSPSWKRKLVLYKPTNHEMDVVIQISNFQHRKGGADDLMIFGKSGSIINYRSSLAGIELFLFGVLFIMGAYHIVLFFFRPKDRSLLYFSLICLMMIIRLITTGEKIILEFMPSLDWLTAVKLEYLSYKLAVPFFMLFFYQFYQEEISRRVVMILVYLAAIFSLIVIFFPPIVFTYTPIFYQVIIAIVAFYLIVCLALAMKHRRENSLIFFVTYLFFVFIVINDILYYNKLISTGFLLPYGVFVLAFAKSIVLSKNLSLTFLRTEKLSIELDNYNKLLEKKVEERTEQIKIQNNELEQQSEKLKASNEQLKELNTFKESLTSMIIHDLKNPLNIVLNFAKDERVLHAGNQMLHLVHNLLDVQRYENSVMKLNCRLVSLHELINSAVAQLNFMVNEKNIDIELKLTKDYPLMLDEEIMSRVFVNLLTNAIKFTPNQGKVSIYIKEKTDSVSICFADSGPGIPKDQQMIFEKFGQLIIKRAGRSGSTGLGLTFCKMATEAHQGSIHYTSVLGKGATFCCNLPKTTPAQTIPLTKTSIKDHKPESLKLHEMRQYSFSTEEKAILDLIIEELTVLEIYEVGNIKRLLKKLELSESEQIRAWIIEVQGTLWNSDSDRFQQLIKMARQ